MKFDPLIEKRLRQFDNLFKESPPLVIITCITYNHKDYIHNALDGFVMQKTNFPFVAVIHDDASTDGTTDIIREYAEKYQNIIFPIFERENQYSKHDGSVRRIFDNVIKCSGAKYIAFCEGDDYWIDPLKLQKQVDFLESHPDFSLCGTSALDLWGDRLSFPPVIHRENYYPSTGEFITKGMLAMRTASICYRAELYYERPPDISKVYVGDIPLVFYLSLRGRLCFLSDITTVYRRVAKGSWSEKKRQKLTTKEGINEMIEKEFQMLDVLDKISDYKFHKDIIARKVYFRADLEKRFSKWKLRKAILAHPLIMNRIYGKRYIVKNLIKPS